MADPQNLIVQHLTDDGTLSGSDTMAVNGSVTPAAFYYQAEASETRIPLLHRILFQVSDGGPFSSSDFGGLATLSNGVSLKVLDANDVEVCDVFGGGTIKTNAEFAEYMYDARADSYGSGDDFVSARLSFDKFMKNGLHLPNRMKLVLTVSDDLSALSGFEAVVEGEFVQ